MKKITRKDLRYRTTNFSTKLWGIKNFMIVERPIKIKKEEKLCLFFWLSLLLGIIEDIGERDNRATDVFLDFIILETPTSYRYL